MFVTAPVTYHIELPLFVLFKNIVLCIDTNEKWNVFNCTPVKCRRAKTKKELLKIKGN